MRSCQLLCTQETQRFVYAGDSKFQLPFDRVRPAKYRSSDQSTPGWTTAKTNQLYWAHSNLMEDLESKSLFGGSMERFKHCKSLCMSKKTRCYSYWRFEPWCVRQTRGVRVAAMETTWILWSFRTPVVWSEDQVDNTKHLRMHYMGSMYGSSFMKAKDAL